MNVRALTAIVLLVGHAGCARMATRRLHCDHQPSARRREVCQAAGRHRELSWSAGHPSFPGLPRYTLPYASLPVIFCELHITRADAAELRRMAAETSDDQGLQSLARELWELSDPSHVPKTSINHPQNGMYRLQDGCASEQR